MQGAERGGHTGVCQTAEQPCRPRGARKRLLPQRFDKHDLDEPFRDQQSAAASGCGLVTEQLEQDPYAPGGTGAGHQVQHAGEQPEQQLVVDAVNDEVAGADAGRLRP